MIDAKRQRSFRVGSRWRNVLLCLGLGVLLSLSATGWGDPKGAGPSERAKGQEARKSFDRQREISNKASAARYRNRGMRAFVDKNGVLLLTDRDKYRRDPQYKEVTIHYEPIVVPDRYRRLRSTSQYLPSDIAGIVSYYSRKYKLDPNLVYAIIRVESNFQRRAVSRAGAQGLMQLMPDTARHMGVRDPFNPAENIAGGTQYLAKLLEVFHGDLTKALAGYNAGPETVKRYKGVPPYKETQQYVRSVRYFASYYRRYGVNPIHFAKMEKDVAGLSGSAAEPRFYRVYFHSGLSQPVENVIEDHPFYYVQFQGQTRRIRKERVKAIEPV